MKQLIQRACHKIVFNAAGCGSSALRELTLHPGSSAIVLEGNQFYSRGSLELALCSPIEKFVSQNTSQDMAFSAFMNANQILVKQKEISQLNASIGVGLTGQIGHHRTNQAFLSIQSASASRTFHLTFPPELDTKEHREIHDTLISDYVFSAISEFNDSPVSLNSQSSNPRINVKLVDEKPWSIFDFLTAKDVVKNVVLYKKTEKEGVLFSVNQELSDCVLFSGSFNPMHEAHVEIALKAREIKNRKGGIYFELALKNADKAQKDYESLHKIVHSMLDKISTDVKSDDGMVAAVVLSNKTLFSEKISFCKNSTFAVGSDTFKRILDNKYYGNCYETKLASLGAFTHAGIDFVLAPRQKDASTDVVETYQDFEKFTPAFMKSKVVELTDYRNDISSTAIRKALEEAGKKEQ